MAKCNNETPKISIKYNVEQIEFYFIFFSCIGITNSLEMFFID